MNIFKTITLYKKLIMWFITIVLISSTLFFLIYYLFSENSVINTVKNNLDSISKNQIKFINYWLDERSKNIKSLTQSQSILSNNPKEVQTIITNFNNINTIFEEVLFVDSQGQALYNSKFHKPLDVSDREYFKIVQNNRDFISDAIISRTTNEPVIAIASPIMKDDSFSGAIIGFIKLSEISRLINLQDFNNISESFIVNRNGDVIINSISQNQVLSFSKNFNKNIFKKNVDKIYKDGNYSFTYINNSKNIFDSYTIIPNKDWILVNEVDISSNIISIRKSSAQAGIITLLLIVTIFTPFILYLSKKLTTPINNIANLAHELSLGNFNKRLDYSSHDEIGSLIDSFNTMIDKLQNTYKELNERIIVLNSQKEEIKLKNLNLEQVIEVNKTILKQLEEKHEQLEQTNTLKAKFLANMSHEFRTPMNSIIGYTEMILDNNDGEINDEQRKDLLIILKSAENLLTMINNILDLSKIEAGKISYNYKKFNIVDELRIQIENIKVLAENKNLEIIFEHNDNILEIYSDAEKINQIVSNLLSNAIKFTDSGSIKLSLSLENESFIKIAVEDTGIGIPKEELPNIFDEFIQVDNSSTRKYGGTGLGLAIVKGFVTGLGGNIDVESTPKVGSCFIVTLPISKSSSIITEKNIEISDEILNPDLSFTNIEQKVMVVITLNANNSNLIESMLKRCKLKVITVNYLDAIETIKKVDPSCIFIDIDLPCTNCNDGWLTLSDIKHDKSISNIPIIIVATQTNEIGFILGADDYLIKPFSTIDMLNCINRCFMKQKRGYVLVIEEDKEISDLISNVLRKSTQYNTLLVSSKKDILSVLESSNLPSLIVLNVTLSTINSIDMINLINSIDIERKIPILALTQKPLNTIEQEFIKQNTDKLLLKSEIRYSKLVSEIKKLLLEIKEM